MVARAMTYEDRLALRLSRDMGIVLSNEEYEALNDGNNDDNQQQLSDKKPTPITDTKGEVDMTTLLVDLLGLLGVKVDASGGDKKFKQALYAATLNKIRELTATGTQGQSNDANGGNPSNKTTKVQNPLLTGQIPAEGKMEPMYFSLANIENMTCPEAKKIALSLACERQSLPQRMHEINVAAARKREAKVDEARARRQVIVNKILRLAPNMRPQLDVMLNATSSAFSTDVHGTVTDPVEQQLRRLEQQLTAALNVAATTTVDSPTTSESDDAVEALARFLR